MQQTLTVTLSILIDSVMTFTPATLPTGTINAAYPPSSIGTVSGGDSPYTFTVASGLPPGMALSAAGVLSGTPTAVGSYSLQVSIKDSGSVP
jgi:hypothetical protein